MYVHLAMCSLYHAEWMHSVYNDHRKFLLFPIDIELCPLCTMNGHYSRWTYLVSIVFIYYNVHSSSAMVFHCVHCVHTPLHFIPFWREQQKMPIEKLIYCNGLYCAQWNRHNGRPMSIVSVGHQKWRDKLCPLNTNGHDWQFETVSNGDYWTSIECGYWTHGD